MMDTFEDYSMPVQEFGPNLTIDEPNGTLNVSSPSGPAASFITIFFLSALFFVIGFIGITGNLLVIVAILSDRRMRISVTNLFIMNLAISDLIIMVACIPDIVQFIENHGWKLGLTLCKILRFTEVFALYASVMTLVSVCVERYIAIIHPIKAHILCCRARILCIIVCIWTLAMICASPNLIFHIILLEIDPNFTPCIIRFPTPIHFLVYKYAEFTLFYLIPLILQVVLYILIGRRLFSTESFRAMEPAIGKEKYAGTMKARRGVVKMLIAGVVVYFISFSPHQVLLFYNTFSAKPFQETWAYLIFVNIMAYASSACNPLIYSIFSQKFRLKFKKMLGCKRAENDDCCNTKRINTPTRSKSLKTTVSEV